MPEEQFPWEKEEKSYPPPPPPLQNVHGELNNEHLLPPAGA